MCEHGTKTTPVFLPADGEASWLLLPSLVSLLSDDTVQPENTYSHILKVTGQMWESQKRISINTNQLGDNGISLLLSLRDSTVRCLELMISSVSATSVLNPSSLRLWPWAISKAARILLALQIWHSQTPPICVAPDGFLYHVIVPICSILQEIISYLLLIHFFQSLSKIIFSTNKYCFIIESYWSYLASSCHESTQSLDKRISLHCASYLNTHCSTWKTCK